MALQSAAQAAFTDRQQAFAGQKQAAADLAEADQAARGAYAAFRTTGRSLFIAAADRTALGLAGQVPDDTEKFVTAARAGYSAALETPAYLNELAQYGSPQATLQAGLVLLDALDATRAAHERAKAAAIRAPQQRDAAAANLDAWLRQFRGIAKVATRGRPDLARKLDL
jgi:hypothetical protein